MTLQISTGFVVGLVIGGVVGFIVGFLVGVVSSLKKRELAGKKIQCRFLFARYRSKEGFLHRRPRIPVKKVPKFTAGKALREKVG